MGWKMEGRISLSRLRKMAEACPGMTTKQATQLLDVYYWWEKQDKSVMSPEAARAVDVTEEALRIFGVID